MWSMVYGVYGIVYGLINGGEYGRILYAQRHAWNSRSLHSRAHEQEFLWQAWLLTLLFALPVYLRARAAIPVICWP